MNYEKIGELFYSIYAFFGFVTLFSFIRFYEHLEVSLIIISIFIILTICGGYIDYKT